MALDQLLAYFQIQHNTWLVDYFSFLREVIHSKANKEEAKSSFSYILIYLSTA